MKKKELNIDDLNMFFDSISPTVEQKRLMLSNILNQNEGETEMKKATKGISMIAVIAAVILLFSGTALAAGLGGLDWLIERFNPAFGDAAVSVGAVSEDQGIRMEVIGAQKFEDQAVVYISLQDVSGQNRLTWQTTFRDGFFVKMTETEPPADGIADRSDVMYGFSSRVNVLDFDAETNTIYYDITLHSDFPLTDPLELGSRAVYFDRTTYDQEIAGIDLSALPLTEAETIPVREEQLSITPVFDNYTAPLEILAVDERIELPHGNPDQWISGIGIIDNHLHVQVRHIYDSMGGGAIYLRNADGDADYGQETMVFADKDGNILDRDNYHGENGEHNFVYTYNDFVYDIDIAELDAYTLYCTGIDNSGVSGDWRVTANIGDGSQMRTWSFDEPVQGLVFERVVLSPLGLSVKGSYTGEFPEYEVFEVILETEDGEINLGTGSANWDSSQTFGYNWSAKESIDVSSVTAVKVNGVYIDMD